MSFSVQGQLSPALRRKLRTEVFVWINRADYRQALKTAADHKKRYPGDLGIAARYASLLGDYAESRHPARRRRLRLDSIRLLRDLLRRTRCGNDRGVIDGLKNEFYWQTKQRKKQYELGGHYPQGVGAAWYSYELAARGRRADAERRARKSIAAWDRYKKSNPKYYNQFVHRALAEGILGRLDAMTASLQRGAVLSGKPLGHHEFVEVRRLVHGLGIHEPS